MRKAYIVFAAVIFTLIFCTCAYSETSEDTQGTEFPEIHAIAYDPALDTLEDEDGADYYNHSLDHPDSRYYIINDYYNMTGGNGLYILPKFRTYQQTTEYTCGCAAALMVLNYYGNCDYNEMDICRLAGTDPARGTTVEGLVQFFDSLGWETVVHADTGLCFQTIDECEWRC